MGGAFTHVITLHCWTRHCRYGRSERDHAILLTPSAGASQARRACSAQAMRGRSPWRWIDRGRRGTSVAPIEQFKTFVEGVLIPHLQELIESAKASGKSLNEFFRTLG